MQECKGRSLQEDVKGMQSGGEMMMDWPCDNFW